MNKRNELYKSFFKALGVEAALFLFYGILPYKDGRSDLAGLAQQGIFCLICGAVLTFLIYRIALRRRR